MTKFEAMKARLAAANTPIPTLDNIRNDRDAMVRNELIRRHREFEDHARTDMDLLLAVVEATKKSYVHDADTLVALAALDAEEA